jgi:hypothetical protein
MTLCSKIDDCPRLIFLKQAPHQILVANITMSKNMPGITFKRGQSRQIARIGKLIEIDDAFRAHIRQPMKHKIAPDEACATRH